MKKLILALLLGVSSVFGQFNYVAVYHSAWGDWRGISTDWFENNGSFMTHIIHFKIDPTLTPGVWGYSGGEGNHTRNRAQIISDAHARGIKVLICIGGDNGRVFLAAAQDSTLLESIVGPICDWARAIGYDGVDLDYESDNPAAEWTLWSRFLRRKLNTWNPVGILTTAAGRTPHAPAWVYNTYYDHINIMLYDGNGWWSCAWGQPGGVAGFHEPLNNPSVAWPTICDGQFINTVYCLNRYEAAGVDKAKCAPSTAFYGYTWAPTVTPNRPGGNQVGCSQNCAGITNGYDIINNVANGSWTRTYDTVAQQPWAVNGTQYVNYQDEQSIAARLDYFKRNGWGGVFFFANEHAVDPNQPNGSAAKFRFYNAIRDNINPPSPSAPVFSVQPSDATVLEGSAAGFSVYANGYPLPTYQWQKSTTVGGSTYANITSATSSIYTTPVTVPADSGYRFRCIATNSQGTATSSYAILRVSAAVSCSPTSDDFKDSTASIAIWSRAGTTSFGGQGSRDAFAKLHVVGMVDIWPNNNYNAPRMFQKPTNLAVGNFEVTVKMQDLVLANRYTFAGLLMKGGSTFYRTEIMRTGTQLNEFSVQAYSAGPSGGTNLFAAPIGFTSGQTAYLRLKRFNGRATVYTSSDGTTFTERGQYDLSSSLDSLGFVAGSGDASANFVVNFDYFFRTGGEIVPEDSTGANFAPTVTVDPVNQSVGPGGNATFSITATGNPSPTYQWQRSDDQLTFSNVAGATSSSYTKTNCSIATDDGDLYRCIATNNEGADTSNYATLNVVGLPPTFVTQPQNTTVSVGQTASFSVTVTGTSPITYQWRKNGVNISGATSSTYTTPITVIGDNGSQFLCVATNSISAVTSYSATLTVLASAGLPPSITSQPANQIVAVSTTATFSVSASGTPTLAYQWQKDGENVTTGTGGATATYVTPAVTTGDNCSSFRCIVSNSYGTVTSNGGILTVTTSGPSITSHPQSVTVFSGSSGTFSVTASGAGTLSYQWQKNNVNVTTGTGGTASTYITPSVSISDNGAAYRCIVSNAYGAVATNSAILTVASAPLTPYVNSFTDSSYATPRTANSFVGRGDQSKVTWETTNADSVWLQYKETYEQSSAFKNVATAMSTNGTLVDTPVGGVLVMWFRTRDIRLKLKTGSTTVYSDIIRVTKTGSW